MIPILSIQWRDFSSKNLSYVSNIDLTSILDSSKSEELIIDDQSLSTEETQAVVRAMTNVEIVELGVVGELTLDISTLVTCDGRGKCKSVELVKTENCIEEVRRWTQRISWSVTRDYFN